MTPPREGGDVVDLACVRSRSITRFHVGPFTAGAGLYVKCQACGDWVKPGEVGTYARRAR